MKIPPERSMSPSQSPSAKEEPPLVMTLLRSGTAIAHKNLEQATALARLFAPDYQLREYRHLLEKFYGFVSQIEDLLFVDCEAYPSALAHRRKTNLLHQDLLAFGLTEPEIRGLPRCHDLPNSASFPQRMGALYVMEGSTLGGRVIAKRLNEQFGTEIADKMHYYSCYGDNTGTEWKAFQRFMGEHIGSDDDTINSVVTSANATFTALQRWFSI